ncbi:MAG: D-hexose-6-phosphate mutarotase [Bacteroidetes bacterium]|nr:D-hexose-6-phosphate mutarotase [Bacteroidota bacterium]
MKLSPLNKKFGIRGKLEIISEHGGLPVAVINNEFAQTLVSIYGAHVLSFQPKNFSEVLWTSSKSMFEEGIPIRGGIPVCFPWFGPHSSDPEKPQHGFARLQMWKITGTSSLPGGETQICLNLQQNPESQKLWPFSFLAEMIITAGTSLNVAFKCTNTGGEKFSCSDALHSYFTVSDIANIRIKGLKGTSYYNGIAASATSKQNDEYLNIEKEENRRYVDTTAECIIEDSGLSRKIRVAKTGSRVTVVWNPGAENSKKITDMPDDGYKSMVCVEAVNAYDDIVTIQPKESHTLTTSIEVETL